MTLRTLEIALEQFDDPFWRSSLANVLGGDHHSVTFRFAGRIENDAEGQDVIGDPFRMRPFDSLDDADEPGSWDETVKANLNALDHAVRVDGWRPEVYQGDHWWSLRYARS